MAYGDYVPSATLLDTCDADTADTPGKSADCKFIAQNEGAGSLVANRPHLALAENMDNMKIPLDTMISQPTRTTFSSGGGTTINVDPTGPSYGTHVAFIGYLYLGDSSYSPPTADGYSTLFQVLDSNYNKVSVDDTEVLVTNTSTALGSGFYNGGVVALTLNKSLPAGTYILVYGVGTTLATLPEDALTRLGVRALQEVPFEMATRKALTQRSTISSFPSGSSLTVDPTGGAAGDVNFTGHLYLGNAAGYSGATQDNFDTLFQFTDDEDNEVVVGGEEIKVTGISGAALGDGFFNGGAVVLTLGTDATPAGVAVPAGNYRLKYARETTLATLPDDALIAAEIRGGHEAAGEVQRRSSFICAIDTSEGPVDFVGASAIEDALSILPTTVGEGFTLRVRRGSYTLPSAWPASGDYIKIVGEGVGETTLTLTSNLTLGGYGIFDRVLLSLGSYDLYANIGCAFSNLAVSGSVGSVLRMAEFFSMRNSSVSIISLDGTSSSRVMLDQVFVSSSGPMMTLSSAKEVFIRSSYFEGFGIATYGIDIDNSERVSFEDCEIQHVSASSRLLYLQTCSDISFKNCLIRGRSAAPYGIEYTTNAKRVSFENCDIRSEEGAVVGIASLPGSAVMSFHNCKFSHEVVGSPTVTSSFAILTGDRVVADNCEFYPSNWSPISSAHSCLALQGVHAKNLLLDMSGQEGNAGLTLNRRWIVAADSTVDGLTVDQGLATTIATPTSVAYQAVDLDASTVRNLKMIGIGGVWYSGGEGARLVRLVGSADREAILDGFEIATRSSAPLWTPHASTALCRLGGEARLSRLVWDDHEIEPGVVVDRLVNGFGSNNTVENCRMIVATNNDDIRSLLQFRLDGSNNRINNNYLSLTPLAQNGVGGPFYNCVYISGTGVLGASNEEGQIYGQFCGNTVRFVGYPQDDGVVTYMVGGPLLFGASVYLWAVDHNVIIAERDNVGGTNAVDHCVFFHEGDANPGFLYKTGAGGCSFAGNIIRAAFSSTPGQPLFAYHDAASPASIVGTTASPADLVAGADDTSLVFA